MSHRSRRPRAALALLLVVLPLAACQSGESAEISMGPQPAAIAPQAGVEVLLAEPARAVHEQQWTPFAATGDIVLVHPSSRVERVGYHESNVDGAQQMESLPTSAPWLELDSRERDTASRGAADVVIDPDVEVRSPVSGQVIASGTYVLYCDFSDDFLIVAPDARPEWQVKVLHIDGVAVRPGDRVEAGETVIAPRPTRLPFESQVEETAATPPWPHVHIEVVDPSIPDRPSGRGC